MLILDDDLDVSINYQYKKIRNTGGEQDIFECFVRTHILNTSTEPLTEKEEYVIELINTYPENIFNNTISILTDLGRFKIIMRRALKYFGNDGNYNWLDVSSCTSFMGLFSSPEFSEFNGDITKWDTRSVQNMLKMFQGCKQFNRDITGWNVSNVKFVNKDTYLNASSELKDMFQKMKAEKKFKNYPMVKL
ncbi:MAG: hypothetical protein [Wendovervirus sonii]|uniref:BspA family leucine-rich repeat surface protein n=1 Tax=phage Lak_Megaphage_Sonny TaxID=3109229 RepID=A0ABZ0Z4T6_9CAUD|nr:MAG: hypothetical protein [phage Lak_Megaphage_Sonny]